VKTRAILEGTGVSPGVAVGPALVVEREATPVFRIAIPSEAIGHELDRFREAVELSRGQLQAIRDRLLREVGPRAYIFDAQLLMLDDALLVERCLDLIRAECVNVEWALRTVSEELHVLFGGFTDDYLRERSSDLDDVIGRIQLNLAADVSAPTLARLPGSFILVAENLSPSQAAEMDWEHVLAIATDAGSPTYHTAILARSLGIPGVVALKDATRRIPAGALVVVDGATGRVVVEPTEEDQATFGASAERQRAEDQRLQAMRPLPATTIDGVRVRLQANVEFAEEAATAVLYGAEGIGLFRSEYLLGRSREWPSEEQQLDLYRRLLEQMRPHPVTVRVWDMGGETEPSGPGSYAKASMGERALRLLRRQPEPFRVQLRALLRAAVAGPLRIMFPFASGPADLRLVRKLLDEVKAALRRDGLEFEPDTPIGLTLEVPGAAATADLLAREVDFFSVGTNDLIQYLLAVDRSDPRVASFYEPLHPAVLRTLNGILRAAEVCEVPVSVCGEMAADPLHALLLVGLGVRELSMSAGLIPNVKGAIRRVRADEAARVVRECLSLSTAGEIEARAREGLRAALGSDTPQGG
jgi:phosphotransferase system enzyme I (PtsI)